MTISLWAIFIIIGGICAFIFAKTVSNDAKNDYSIRDILSNNDDSEPVIIEKQIVEAPRQEYKEETNIYDEIIRKQQAQQTAQNQQIQENQQEQTSYNNAYSTTTHEDTPKHERSNYEQQVFYEKINDDACPYDKDENKDDDYFEDDDYEQEKPIKTVKKRRSLFDYVKTFWHGITFTIGIIICIYSFIGISTQVQTSNDAIIYSIWLLIGVILIK